MDTKEAIEYLKIASKMLLDSENKPISDLYYAYEIAIKALEEKEGE